MNDTHYVRKCKHGIIIEQCRCPDPGKLQLEGPCPMNCPHVNEPLTRDEFRRVVEETRNG